LSDEGPKSATERYITMKTTQQERLAFGKSAIHGWGVFAKQRHAKSSFVTEYAGEVVRQAVADAREKNLYNSIVVRRLKPIFRILVDPLIFSSRVSPSRRSSFQSSHSRLTLSLVALGGCRYI
jgi:hypothetical protein